MTQEPQPEIVNLAIGLILDPEAETVPVTIFDQESRRVRYTRAPKAQLAVMGDAKTAQWLAYWSAGSWRLADMINDNEADV